MRTVDNDLTLNVRETDLNLCKVGSWPAAKGLYGWTETYLLFGFIIPCNRQAYFKGF